MTELDFFRGLIAFLPAMILVYFFVEQDLPLKRWVGGLFATIWQFQWRLILWAGGVELGLWQFKTDQMLFLNVPIDIVLGFALLLGFLPRIVMKALFKTSNPIILLVILFIVEFDLIIIFLPIRSFTSGSDYWLLLIASLAIVPSVFLAHWTEQSEHVYLRSLLQNTSWAILLLWLFPSIIFHYTMDSWQPFLDLVLEGDFLTKFLYLSPLVIPAVLILNALYVFAKQGQGTGFPYDAPKYLVTTGIYRYISNPMQLGIVLMMSFWGVILQSTYVLVSAAVAFVLFLVFKNVCNGSCQLGVTDPEWEKYQARTPKWIPIMLGKNGRTGGK